MDIIAECAVASNMGGGRKATYARLYEEDGRVYLEVQWRKGDKTGEERYEGSLSKLEKKLEKLLKP
jgi:hypothetical protein